MGSRLNIGTHIKRNNAITQECLIDQYNPKVDTFFATPKCTLLGKPPFADLLSSNLKSIAEQAKQSLRFAKELGIEAPMVMGAINFDADSSSHLRVAKFVRKRFGREVAKNTITGEAVPISNHAPAIQASPSPAVFSESVSKALETMSSSELSKVVLSRTLQVQYKTVPDVKQLLNNLYQKNAHGYTFGVNLKPLPNIKNQNQSSLALGNKIAQDLHVLIGASPELLISKKGKYITAHPLAGSEPRTHVKSVDADLAKRLKNSEKDQREHALVVQSIQAALEPFCKALDVPQSPSLVKTNTMLHLGTLITGELKDESTTSLELALALHPTPAICGHPVSLAKKEINKLEGYPRNLYAGMVGWCDENGDGEWAVTIRCAEVKDNEVTIYAGAGIVEGSSPQKETCETAAKFNTMLNAMGITQR